MTSPETMDGRLGRRFVGHDDRNRGYGVRALIPARGLVERVPTFWPIPPGNFPLDQQAEGACEAFGMAQELAAGPVVVDGISNEWALSYYRRVQATDRAMGNDFPDGATTQANMKTAKAENLITGYRWAFGVDDVVDTLCSVGPVCIGIDWFASMYSTTPDGLVRISGSVVGGHFIDLLGYDVHPVWGPCVLWLNSWGSAYGVADARLNVRAGVGWVPIGALDLLLKRNGEAVIPADFFVSTPQPTPQPSPEPGPPQPTPADPATAPYVATARGVVFHSRRHPFIRPVRFFATYAEAVAAGLRPCRWCRP